MSPKFRARAAKAKAAAAQQVTPPIDQSTNQSNDQSDNPSDQSESEESVFEVSDDDGSDFDDMPASKSTKRKKKSGDSDDESINQTSLKSLRSVIGNVSLGTCKNLLKRANNNVEQAVDAYFSMTNGSPSPPATDVLPVPASRKRAVRSSPSLSVSQSISQSTSQSSKQTINQSNSQSISKSNNQAVKPSLSPPLKPSVGKSIDSSSDSDSDLDSDDGADLMSYRSMLSMPSYGRSYGHVSAKRKQEILKGRSKSAQTLLKRRLNAQMSDDDDGPRNPSLLPESQRLSHYYLGQEIDFQFKGKWFPGEVIEIIDHAYLVEVNYSNGTIKWPRECSQMIDPRSDRIKPRGDQAQNYHVFEQVEVFTEPPTKPLPPDQHLYNWPGIDADDEISVAEMLLGELTIEIASDRDPSRPEFYDCIVSTACADQKEEETKFELMKQWLQRQSPLIRVDKIVDDEVAIKAPSDDDDKDHSRNIRQPRRNKKGLKQSVQQSLKLSKPDVSSAKGIAATSKEQTRLKSKLHADPSFLAINRWMKLGRDPFDICLANHVTELDDEFQVEAVHEIREMLVDAEDEDIDQGLDATITSAFMGGLDSDDDDDHMGGLDSDDCGSSMALSLTRRHRGRNNRSLRARVATMCRRAFELMRGRLTAAETRAQTQFLESDRPIKVFTLTMRFYVQHGAQISSPSSTNLSLTPLNALMKALFPNSSDLQSKIAEAEAEPRSSLLPTVKLDKLMECAVRDERGQPFYYETKRMEAEKASMSTSMSTDTDSSDESDLLSSSLSSEPLTAPSAIAEAAVEPLPADEDELQERCETISQQCSLSITLRDYQVHTVQWMLAQEREQANTNMYVWSQLRFVRAPDADDSSELPLFFYSPLLQRFRFKAMPDIKGGFNCEEMGLGKTINALSLINVENQTNEAKRRLSDAANGSSSNSSPSPVAVADVEPDEVEAPVAPPKNQRRSRKRKAAGADEVVQAARDSMDRRDPTGRVFTGATLVVAPVSLVGQWAAELNEKSTRPLRVCLFYGGSRPRTVEKLLNYDVIITSYGVASSELNLGNNRAKKLIEETPWKYHGKYYQGYSSLLSQLHFHRVILDESHTIRVAGNTASRAAYEIIADRRWLLSGTPVNTSLLDLRGQLEFLEMQGFIGQVWKDTDNILVQNKDFPRVGRTQRRSAGRLSLRSKKRLFNLFTNVVTKSMIRHEKKQPFNGRSALIILPPKSVTTVLIEPTPTERKALDIMYNHAKARFEDYKSIGVAVRRSIEVLQLLQPLRIACSGGTVDMRAHRERMRAELERDAVRTVIEKFREKDSMNLDAITSVATAVALNSFDDACTICLDILQQPIQTKCRHLFCGECVRSLLLANRGSLKGTGQCPLCRTSLSIDELYAPNFGDDEEEAELTRPRKKVKTEHVDGLSDKVFDEEEEEKKEGDDEEKTDESVESDVVSFTSKINMLFSEIDEMHRASPTYKALIFTQYLSTMELLKTEFASRSIRFETLEGHMTMNQRKKNLDTFRKDPECTVFLLSMRAGAVGLTLTAASHVFILEPAVNPATEQQAIGRIHRLGNVHPQVTVKYLVMKGTVEEKLMALNREKMATIEKQLNKQHGIADEDQHNNDQSNNQSNDQSDEKTPEVESETEEQPRFGRHATNANIDSTGAGVNAVSLGSLQNDVAMFRLSELNKLFA